MKILYLTIFAQIMSLSSNLSSLNSQTSEVSFEALLNARFHNGDVSQYQRLRSWIWNITPEERAAWLKHEQQPDGTFIWKKVIPCASLDSRGTFRAMTEIIDHAASKRVAKQQWRAVLARFSDGRRREVAMIRFATRRAVHRQSELGAELAVRAVKDQAWRSAQAESSGKPYKTALFWLVSASECHTDLDNLLWIKSIVSKRVWPTFSKDGRSASDEAAILVQHADDDRPLQKEVLAILKPLVLKKEASAENFALLFDRLEIADGRPQQYGTQLEQSDEGCLKFSNLSDPFHVGERRLAIGLITIEKYAKAISKLYKIQLCKNYYDVKKKSFNEPVDDK